MLHYTYRVVGDIDVSDLEEVLNIIFNPKWPRTYCIPFSTNYSQSTTDVYESSVQHLLQSHVIQPIAQILSNSHQPISSRSQPIVVKCQRILGLEVDGLSPIVPDVLIKVQDRPFLVGKIKRYLIFRNISTFEEALQNPNCFGFLKQLFSYMIALGVTRGFLSDSQTTCSVEIESGSLSKVNNVMNIPLKGTIMVNQSSSPSILQVFMYFIYKSKQEDVNLYEKIREAGYFNVNDNPVYLRIPSSFNLIEQLMGTPLSINSDHIAQLMKVSGSTIKELIEEEIMKEELIKEVKDSDAVIIKVFNKNFPKIRKLSREDIEYLCDGYYETKNGQ